MVSLSGAGGDGDGDVEGAGAVGDDEAIGEEGGIAGRHAAAFEDAGGESEPLRG